MGSLVVKVTEVTRLVVVAVAVMVVVTATPTRDNLGSSSSSLELVAEHLDNLDTKGAMEAILMVADPTSSNMVEVVVATEDVLAEEGRLLVRSFVTGAIKWVTLPQSVKRW